MKASTSFDRAADFYDATRGYPDVVQHQVGAALIAALGANSLSHLLEIGVGTGRIARSIVCRGIPLTGIDISARMLDKLRGHLDAEYPHWAAQARFLQADAMALPFEDDEFDGALCVHVLHLVQSWQVALAELARVVRPGGIIVRGWDTWSDERANTDIHEIDAFIRATVTDLGAQWASSQSLDIVGGALDQYLTNLGAQVTTSAAVQWTRPEAPSQRVDWFVQRIGSSTWQLPDALHAEASRLVQAWASDRFGPTLGVERPVYHTFMISRAELP